MSLVTMKELLTDAQQGGYAVGSFTVWNTDFIRAALDTAEGLRAPVIVMFGPVEADYNGPNGMGALAGAARDLIERSSIPAALHFDHGMNVETVTVRMRAGSPFFLPPRTDGIR